MQRSATSAVRETAAGHWAIERKNLVERPQPSFAVGKAGRAQLGDGRLESNGRQHILKIAPPGIVVMNISRGDQRHARGRGRALPLGPIAVRRQGRDAARPRRRFDQERLRATAVIPTCRSPA